MIELQDATKHAGGIVHVKPTTLTLRPGRFNVLLGATGSGKTSLIRLMAGLDPAAHGRVLLDGRDVTRMGARARGISMVHQFFVNYPHMTVFENIASPLRVAGMAESEVRGRVEEAADLLKLRPALGRRPGELSGGQQQRTALARAIVKESRAVFLDEPLANLDYKLREELREQLPELFAGRGAVVVYATSEPEEALLLGGSVALMEDGRVVQFGSAAEIYRDPQNVAAARIFSDPPINLAEVAVSDARARLTGGGNWPVADSSGLPDGVYTVAIRPHRVAPYRRTESDVELEGTVIVTEISGSDSSAHFRHGDDAFVSLAPGVHPCSPGQETSFYMNPVHCRYFDRDGRRMG